MQQLHDCPCIDAYLWPSMPVDSTFDSQSHGSCGACWPADCHVLRPALVQQSCACSATAPALEADCCAARACMAAYDKPLTTIVSTSRPMPGPLPGMMASVLGAGLERLQPSLQLPQPSCQLLPAPSPFPAGSCGGSATATPWPLSATARQLWPDEAAGARHNLHTVQTGPLLSALRGRSMIRLGPHSAVMQLSCRQVWQWTAQRGAAPLPSFCPLCGWLWQMLGPPCGARQPCRHRSPCHHAPSQGTCVESSGPCSTQTRLVHRILWGPHLPSSALSCMDCASAGCLQSTKVGIRQ